MVHSFPTRRSSDLVLLAQILTPLVALWLTYRVEVLRSRQVDTTKKVEGVKQDVAVVRHEANGMKDRLVALTDRESFARGVKSEVDKQSTP